MQIVSDYRMIRVMDQQLLNEYIKTIGGNNPVVGDYRHSGSKSETSNSGAFLEDRIRKSRLVFKNSACTFY
jgi:hypothetical protein